AMGTTVRMGPGYVPHMLAYIMMGLGGLICIITMFTGGEAVERPKWKPITLVTIGIVLFALLFERTGMLPALIVLVLVSSLGGDHRHAAADHLSPAANRIVDHAGGHLLRRPVRRFDDLDPGQPAGRGLVGGHLSRRLPDGPQGPRRRGPVDLGGRLVLCRHRR